MKFCPKCKKLLMPSENEEGKLVCRACGYEEKSEGGYKRSEKVEKKESVVIIEKREINLPKTKTKCPECGNNEAYYWIEQTRSADEAPTRFYRCVKCNHTWREYS